MRISFLRRLSMLALAVAILIPAALAKSKGEITQFGR